MPPSKLARQERRAEFKREFARHLRSHPTDAERKLWGLLRNKHMVERRFRRQHPIGPYIVDFFCAAAKLVVELDGGQHSADDKMAYDETRTQWLVKRGYRVLRISNVEFLKRPEDVLERILVAMGKGPLPESPSAIRPPLKGRVE